MGKIILFLLILASILFSCSSGYETKLKPIENYKGFVITEVKYWSGACYLTIKTPDTIRYVKVLPFDVSDKYKVGDTIK